MSTKMRGGLEVTDEQDAIVASVAANPLTVVSAGAGSGKTHTTAAAVLDLVAQFIATIDQFILITFTDAAADELRKRMEMELRKRVKSAAGPDERRFWAGQQERLSGAVIGTIHSFCQQLLRTYGYDQRVAREFGITFARGPLTAALKDSLEATAFGPGSLLGTNFQWNEFDVRELAEEILTFLRNRGTTAAWLLERTRTQPKDQGKPYREAMAELVAKVERRYSELKEEAQAIDATDLLTRTADMLEAAGADIIRQRVGSQYRYLFIDEFQDTDLTQKRIVDALKNALAAVLVVGDRKQSVYNFRGANVALLEQLARENNVPVLPLSISRRPTRALLAAQNALFLKMSDRYRELGQLLQPSPVSLNPDAGPAPLYLVLGPKGSGIACAAAQIKELLGTQIQDPKTGQMRDVEPGDIAVLVRTNPQLQRYAAGLRAAGLPVREEAGGRFYQQPEIVATYRMLLLLLHYPNDTILAEALETPYLRQVDAWGKLKDILQYGTREPNALTDWVVNEDNDLQKQLRTLRDAVKTDTVAQLIAGLYDAFGIREYYAAQGNQQAAENLEKLRELSRRLFNEEQALNLREFVGFLGRAISSDKEEMEAVVDPSDDDDQRPPYIRVTTIHRSKGLEYPIVVIPELQRRLHQEMPKFLVDPVNGLEVRVPVTGVQNTMSDRAPATWNRYHQEQLEEEMRVLYVAVTRAKQTVVLVGSGIMKDNPPGNEYYSWKDEVVRAWPDLQSKGARLVNG